MRIGSLIAIALGLALGCGKSDNAELQREMKRQADQADQQAATAAATARDAVPPPAVDAAPPAPEPTTPEEIEAARKQAMIDGRDQDVLKYCELGKVDPDKSDPQILLGCALAACRIGDADRARGYAKGIDRGKQGKALMDQARKTCLANKVGL